METKKSVQPQPKKKNKRPNDSAGNNKAADQQSRQLPNTGEPGKLDENSFERNPGGQVSPEKGKRAVINQEEHIINEEEEMEEDQVS